jgi:hypothetical protein
LPRRAYSARMEGHEAKRMSVAGLMWLPGAMTCASRDAAILLESGRQWADSARAWASAVRSCMWLAVVRRMVFGLLSPMSGR